MQTWTDYKCSLKKKAANIKKSQNGTGGGPAFETSLSTLEQRALSVLGKTFYAGCGTEERGVSKYSCASWAGFIRNNYISIKC